MELTIFPLIVVFLIIVLIFREYKIRQLSRLSQLAKLEAEALQKTNQETVKFLEETTLYAKEMFAQAELTRGELAKRDRKVRLEMEIARTIHRGLLPAGFPEIPGFSFGISFKPCFCIGGDFFDVIPFPEPYKIGIIFADITGHGVAGAMLTAMLKFQVQLAFKDSVSPEATLRSINKTISESFPPGFFVSMFFVLLDGVTGNVSYVNASPELSLLVKASGEMRNLSAQGGRPLGLLDIEDENDLKAETFHMESGDVLFLITDGLVDISNERGDRLGRKNLMDLLKKFHSLPPQEIVDQIYLQAKTFAGEMEMEDDVMILAIRAEELSQLPHESVPLSPAK